jgi:hypothetical protein
VSGQTAPKGSVTDQESASVPELHTSRVAVDGRPTRGFVRVIGASEGEVLVSISSKPSKLLEDLSVATHSEPADLIEKGIVLVGVAIKARKQGLRLGVVDSDGRLVTEIIGF